MKPHGQSPGALNQASIVRAYQNAFDKFYLFDFGSKPSVCSAK